MKKTFFSLLISCLALSIPSYAMELEEINYFQKMPKPLIVEIGDYLYGKNFSHFCLSDKKIHSILRESKKFSLPEKEEALGIIKNTPFHHLTTLLAKWERADKSKAVPLLRGLKENFTDFYPVDEDANLEPYRKNFDIYFKILNLLYGMGDVKCEEMYKELYNKTGNKFYDAAGTYKKEGPFFSPNLYMFYYEESALLSSEKRKYFLEDYQGGGSPFKKLRVENFLKPFELPLSEKLFHQKRLYNEKK